jgi:hypothetical protein
VNIRAVPGRSDLTGKAIEGDAARRLDVRFPDGRRRELLVTAEEADDLAGKGRDTSSRGGRIARTATGVGRPLVKWVLLSLLGVLVVQALTKQWSDRQKELELKKSLVSDIGSSAYQAFAEARTIAFLPREQRTRERRLVVLTDWIRDEGRIDGVFRSYLAPTAKHPATRQWIDFRNALYSYLRLACCESADGRRAQLDGVTASLRGRGQTTSLPPNESGRWQTLDCGPGCAGYAAAYDWLGRQVLLSAPYRAIETSNPTGFSNGFRDFLHDAIPGY